MNWIKDFLNRMKQMFASIFWHIRKTLLDIVSVCYEDQEYEVMSLPRLAFFAAICMFIVAWVAEQFFGKPFDHFDSLVNAIGVCGASYVGKKFADHTRIGGKND